MSASPAGVALLRVEYFHDPESNNWHFRVPLLGIVGGGETRTEAERLAREAIIFTIAGDADESRDPSTDVQLLPVTVGA